MNYAPIKQRYFTQSDITNKLIKRKRILEFSGGTLAEWLQLAEDFLADDCRLNHAYCMREYKRLGGEIEAPIAFTYDTEDPEVEQKDYTDF